MSRLPPAPVNAMVCPAPTTPVERSPPAAIRIWPVPVTLLTMLSRPVVDGPTISTPLLTSEPGSQSPVRVMVPELLKVMLTLSPSAWNCTPEIEPVLSTSLA